MSRTDTDTEHADSSRLTLLALSGSSRTGSWNSAVLSHLSDHMRRSGKDVDVEQRCLSDFDLPIFNADHEAEFGLPQCALDLQDLIYRCDGLVIACPEYNGSVTPLLKNAIDWSSRPSRSDYKPSVFWFKPTLIAGASISPFGAVRAITDLRDILGKLGAIISPMPVLVPNAQNAFENGALKNGPALDAISSASAAYLTMVKKLTSSPQHG